MAIQNPYTGGSAALSAVPEEYQPQALQNLQQQRMAQLLMAQGQQQPQGQMISGHYVKASPFQNLAALANQALGMYAGYQADKGQLGLAKAIREGERSALADYMQTKEGRPAEMFAAQAGPMPTGGNIPLQESRAAISPNAKAAYANLFADPRASAKLQEFAFGKMNEGPMKVGVDDVLLDPNTLKPIYEGAGKDPEKIRSAAIVLGLDSKPRKDWTAQDRAMIDNQIQKTAKAGATNINMPTEGERKAGFMSTILDKNILQMQTALGVDPKAVKPNVAASVVESVTGPNLLSRSMKPAQRQIVEDSQLDVLDAALTLRTGAAYTREQLNAMRDTYFPVLGDKPQAITAKKQRLETLLDGAYIAAGRATPQRVSSPPPPPAPNNPIVGNTQQTNLPKPTGPRFIGFETPFTGNQ